MLIFGADRELALWAGERLGIRDFGPSTTIGVARRGEIVAVAVFNNFSGPNVDLTFVSSTPRWASKATIRDILRYPFIQLGCKRLSALTHENNTRAQSALDGLGFQREGFHPDAFPDGAGISYGLLRDAAKRWIGELDG